jgi:hypothetical protein
MQTVGVRRLRDSISIRTSVGFLPRNSRGGSPRAIRRGTAVLPLAALLLVASSALPSRAEDAPKDITLSLTPAEVSYVWGVLAKQPYQDVAVLIQKMQAQVQLQAAKQSAAPAKNDKK